MKNLSRRNALDQAIEKYKVQQADHTRIRTELEEAKARMSETLHAPATGPVIGPQFQDLSENGGDSDPDEGDADMDDVVQPEVHQTSEEMFSHVDHEDCELWCSLQSDCYFSFGGQRCAST